MRYSESKNGVNLKLEVGVIQGHWKWRRSIDHIRLFWSAIVYIALSGTVFERLDVEKYRDLEIWVRRRQGNLKWCHSKAWVRFPIRLP